MGGKQEKADLRGLCQSTESSVLPEIGLVVVDQDLRRHTEPHYRFELPVDLNPELRSL